MIQSGELRSGKGSHDENFPVASRLIKRRHRPVILAFYEFVRVADDIADHPALASAEKIARLDRLEASLLGNGDEPEGLRLHAVLNSRGLST
ncbi:MAG: squalene/phytoene synthase family protein, partial [Pseudolabrys sp.]